MAAFPSPLVDIPLSLFSGMDPELAPTDCPEGISPDNQDMVFVPGNTTSRPCLQRVLTFPLPNNAKVLYHKTFVQPNGDPLTLILDSNGIFWMEDLGNFPGQVNQIGATTPGLYAQSCSGFGREYIAVSDLLHGQDIPRQFDGTHLDRVSQDGPGAGPTVSNYLPGSVSLGTAGGTFNIQASTGIIWGGTQFIHIPSDGTISFYTYFTVTTTTPHGLSAGQTVTIAGTSVAQANGTYPVQSILNATQFTIAKFEPTTGVSSGGGGTVQLASATGNLVRANNVVSASTTTAHGFLVGWQVQISGVANTNIGGGITAITRDGFGVVTVTTTSAHGLGVGDTVAIAGVSNPDASFNAASVTVTNVISATVFTYQQNGTAESSSAGTGNVQDIWNTTAFIQTIPSPTTFTYQSLGPNDSTTSAGTAGILGQVSAGTHQVSIAFLTRQGAITKPSPPISVVAPGGQMFAFSNCALGPANVIARLIILTGAGGSNFFALPATPQVAGQVVGQALVIPDNTTTAGIFDFSDNSLFAGIAVDQVGNDLFDQVVLGPVAAFFEYDSRLFTWGEWNKVENFLAMSFCGGYLPSALTAPFGWNSAGNSGGALVSGGPWAAGQSWQITGDGTGNQKGLLTQGAYQDNLLDAILSPSTSYGVRFWGAISTPGIAGFVWVTLTSASTGFSSTMFIPANQLSLTGGFIALSNFSQPMPAVVPSDLILSIYATSLPNGGTVTLAELEIIYLNNPYLGEARASYVLNPEAYAETTGGIGPEDDTSAIQCMSLQRNSVLLKTLAGTHIFQANDDEPGEWTVNQISRSVGACSIRGGDPGSFGTGDASEDWDLSFNQNGLYLFAGGEFWKVSQEMQPYIDSINWAAMQTIVIKNDVHNRRAYLLIPTGTATTPNLLLVMDYRELDTAYQIASSPPIHISFTGKMICSDLTRKWSRWNIPANSAEVILRPGNQKTMVFGAGAFGQIYSLNPLKYTDDDLGQMFPYYVTYFFVNHEQEQQLGVGSGRKLIKKVCAYVTGIGNVTFTPLVDSMLNALPASSARQLAANTSKATAQTQDLEWTTGIRGERIALKFQVAPLTGQTDVQMSLQKLIVTMAQDPIAVRRSSRL